MLLASAQIPSGSRRWLVAGIGLLLVAAAPADTEPPVIQHTPITAVDPGTVFVDFTVSDQSALFGVIFHWRFAGESEYKQIEFPTNQKTFHATLDDVTRNFEFWIEAYDEFGNGPALDGTSDRPNKVEIILPKPKEEPKPVVEEKPKPEEKPIVVEPPPPPPYPPEGEFMADRTNRVEAAWNIPSWRAEMRISGNYFFGSDFIVPGTSVAGGSGTLEASFSPLQALGLHVGVGMQSATFSSTAANSTSAFPMTSTSIGDWTLAARLAWPQRLGILHIALEPSLGIPAADWCQAPSGSSTASCAFGNIAVSPGVTMLLSVELPHFFMHVNVGYLWDNSSNVATRTVNGVTYSDRPTSMDTFVLGLSQYDDFAIHVAMERPSGPFDPYVEWMLDIPVDRDHYASCTPGTINGKAATCAPLPSALPAAMWQTPDRLAIGFRIDLNSRMRLDAGFEASLTQAGSSLVLPTVSSTTAAQAKTAEAIPIPGVVLPPPFAVHLSFAIQFDVPRPAGVPAFEALKSADEAMEDIGKAPPKPSTVVDMPPTADSMEWHPPADATPKKDKLEDVNPTGEAKPAETPAEPGAPPPPPPPPPPGGNP